MALTEITLPESVTEIRTSAFEECMALTNITLPENLTEIESSTFEGCMALTEITLPPRLSCIGDFAFCGCKRLTEITIPKGVTAIGKSVFSGCTGLAEITIPKGVTAIDYEAFDRCTSLISVTCCSTQLNLVNFGKHAKCPAVITTLGGDQHNVVITVPRDNSSFNPKKEVFESLKPLNVVNSEDQFEIIYEDSPLETLFDTIWEGKVDFNHLILVYNY